MWRNAWRDLRWRWRRFVVALAGAALVFASALLMAGLSRSFHEEISDSLGAIGADNWAVRQGGGGPFTSFRLMPEARAQEIGRLAGVERADPFMFLRQTLRTSDGLVDTNLVGYSKGGIGAPRIWRGRGVVNASEIVVDSSLDVPLGAQLEVGGRKFKVVGLTSGMTLFAGSPNVYLPVSDVQDLLLFGQHLVNVVVVRGTPSGVPSDLHVMSTAEVADDVLRPLGDAVGAIEFAQRILWVVAAFVIGAVVYTSALERARDFAVFKATGVSSGYVLGGLALQAVVVSIVAGIVAIGVARVLVPLFPLHVRLPVGTVPPLLVETVVVGLIASLFGARHAVSADPALAFGGP